MESQIWLGLQGLRFHIQTLDELASGGVVSGTQEDHFHKSKY